MRSLGRKLLVACPLVAAALAWVPLEASEGAAAAPEPGLIAGPRLVWSDPQGLMPFGRQRLAEEFAALFLPLGIAVELDLTDVLGAAAGTPLRVEVLRAPKPHWRLRDDVMAAAPRAEGYRGTIYVFLDQVRRVLGYLGNRDPSAAPREHRELATALARILAHEVVHLVAPDHPHAGSGLMVANLRRAALLKKRARMDPGCAQAFREGLVAGSDHSSFSLTSSDS